MKRTSHSLTHRTTVVEKEGKKTKKNEQERKRVAKDTQHDVPLQVLKGSKRQNKQGLTREGRKQKRYETTVTENKVVEKYIENNKSDNVKTAQKKVRETPKVELKKKKKRKLRALDFRQQARHAGIPRLSTLVHALLQSLELNASSGKRCRITCKETNMSEKKRKKKKKKGDRERGGTNHWRKNQDEKSASSA